MEESRRHQCKLCHRDFANGRSLGGHVRSHFLAPSYDDHNSDPDSDFESSSFTSEDEDEELGRYELRENPKQSIKLISDVEEVINPTRKRSKRRFGLLFNTHNEITMPIETTSPASSVSELMTSQEDVAFCLMMMSRDNWPNDQTKGGEKFTCLTCNKVFKSYQALGGHRASHKKLRQMEKSEPESKPDPSYKKGKSKAQECPVCLRVFGSAQALGGHKRTHSGARALRSNAIKESVVIKREINVISNNLIDLNLPAPEEEEDYDRISVSTVSD